MLEPVLLLQPLLHLHWHLFVTLFAARPEVYIVEFALFGELAVTECTGKVFWTPGFVQCGNGVAENHLIAHETDVSKQLVIVGLTVSQSLKEGPRIKTENLGEIQKTNLLFVVFGPEEWFLAFGAHKMLHMPLFAEGTDHSFFDRSATRTTNRYTHLVVTS